MLVCLDARVRDVSLGGARQVVVGLAWGLSRLGEVGDEYRFLSYPDAEGWLAPHLQGPSRQELVADVRASRAVQRAKRLPLMRPLLELAAPLRARGGARIPASDGTVEAIGADVVHFLLSDAFTTRVPSVFQLHDLQYLHLPDLFPRRVRELREHRDRLLCEQARTVAVMSSWSKQDLVARLGVDPAKIAVVPWASVLEVYAGSRALPDDVLSRFQLPGRFVLYPAQTWPHKNHVRLLEALALLRDEYGERVPLVLTGASTRHRERIDEAVRRLHLQEQVFHCGFVSGPELAALYEKATAVVFPTQFEGFGMPVVEALASGTPLACSRVCNLPELVGGAALLFDPVDVDSIAHATHRLWVDEELRSRLSVAGPARAAEFSWDRTAQVLRAVYRTTSGASLSGGDAALLAEAGRA